MLNRVTKIPQHTTKIDLVAKINELADRLNAVTNINMVGGHRLNQTPFGTTIHFKNKPSTAVKYATIIRRPSYPDPTANPITEADKYIGREFYMLRPTGTTYPVYDNSIDYELGDHVLFPDADGQLYVCTAETPEAGLNPLDVRWWEEADELRIDRALAHEKSDDYTKSVRDCVPWYEEGEVVPYITRDLGTGTVRHYIDLAMFWTGTAGNSSLRYNETQQRTMAVFS